MRINSIELWLKQSGVCNWLMRHSGNATCTSLCALHGQFGGSQLFLSFDAEEVLRRRQLESTDA
jgi:hypothetical protein